MKMWVFFLAKCEADPKYCQNGGTCIEKSDSEVVCACVSPYIGTVCDIRSGKVIS